MTMELTKPAWNVEVFAQDGEITTTISGSIKTPDEFDAVINLLCAAKCLVTPPPKVFTQIVNRQKDDPELGD